jgi:AcrR family transcriptional regulator
MSISYEQSGRIHQKARTRDALLAAARELLARGETPTVGAAAAAASISRATAYRYFPNQQALLLAAYPEIGKQSLLDAEAPSDADSRLDLVLRHHLEFTVEHEPELRAILRLSLDPDPEHPGELVLRRGRAIRWIEDALEPLRGQLSEQQLRRLVLAIRSAAGIEALIWLTDIARLSRRQALDLMRWSAHALLRHALTESQARPHP